MTSSTSVRRTAVAASAAALIGMGFFTACSTKEKPPVDSPPSSSPTASALPSPTEKAITPGSDSGRGPNSFSPTVKARPAPTALPGNVITGG